MTQLITFASGSIEAAHYYSTKEIMDLLNLSHWSLQRFKDKGVMFTKVGKSDFYLGEDLIKFLANNKESRKMEAK